METLLPKWIMKRYLVLEEAMRKQKNGEFDFDSAEKALAKIGDDKRIVGLFLSELRKAGWLEVKLDEKDGRKRVYKLKDYQVIFNNYVKSVLLNEKR